MRPAGFSSSPAGVWKPCDTVLLGAVIVRWGLDSLRPLVSEIDVERPLCVTTSRWVELCNTLLLGSDVRVFAGVRAHAGLAGVKAADEAAAGSDGLVAVGGGSAIDTAKAVSARRGLPVVSVPTTYS